jgi:hypothetical protein
VVGPLAHRGERTSRAVPARGGKDAPSSAAVDLGAVVLEPTRRGREDLDHPRFGLRSDQRRLLARLDGHRSLAACADADPPLPTTRLARDAARLVAFGLARQVRGELPRRLMVEAMDLTARISLHQLRPLEPERAAMPMVPRVAPSPNLPGRIEAERAAPAGEPRWPIAVLVALLAGAMAAIVYFG